MHTHTRTVNLHLLDYGEEYVMNFPNIYVRLVALIKLPASNTTHRGMALCKALLSLNPTSTWVLVKIGMEMNETVSLQPRNNLCSA